MDELELRITKRLDAFGGPADEVDILVNGVDFLSLVREVERPFAAEEGLPFLAGSYTGLPPEAVFLPSRRLLGEPDGLYDDEEEKICLLGCGCGVIGCWPLMARIAVEGETVVWSDFEQPHRADDTLHSSERRIGVWRYNGFGPFVFEKSRYVAELGKLRGLFTSSGEPRI
ncbi:MAG: hypothetical protein H0U65_11135 [Rubrobacter sp.]|nr:hypothetical protein [Rubrobacter sp.]